MGTEVLLRFSTLILVLLLSGCESEITSGVKLNDEINDFEDEEDETPPPGGGPVIDYSKPQYTFQLGVKTNAQQFRMNQAVNVLMQHCHSCHGTSGSSPKWSSRNYYKLSSWRGNFLVKAGDPGSSLLITSLRRHASVNGTGTFPTNSGRRDMPPGGTLSYKEFATLWDWILYLDPADDDLHSIRIPPLSGNATYTANALPIVPGDKTYFTLSLGDSFVIHNDDSRSHTLGGLGGLFNPRPGIPSGSSSIFTIIGSGLTLSLGGTEAHSDTETGANFFMKVE